MGLWWCNACSLLVGPEHGPCPRCGEKMTFATVEQPGGLERLFRKLAEAQVELPAEAARVLRENLWELYDTAPPLPSGETERTDDGPKGKAPSAAAQQHGRPAADSARQNAAAGGAHRPQAGDSMQVASSPSSAPGLEEAALQRIIDVADELLADVEATARAVPERPEPEREKSMTPRARAEQALRFGPPALKLSFADLLLDGKPLAERVADAIVEAEDDAVRDAEAQLAAVTRERDEWKRWRGWLDMQKQRADSAESARTALVQALEQIERDMLAFVRAEPSEAFDSLIRHWADKLAALLAAHKET